MLTRRVDARLVVDDCGDSAVLVAATVGDSESKWRLVHRLANWVNEDPQRGHLAAIATYESVLVEFDPAITDHTAVRRLLTNHVESLAGPLSRPAATFRLPVAYGGDFGPDLHEVADFLGLRMDDVVQMHARLTHPMRCLSHHAAAMLDGPPFDTPIPRLTQPRLRAPGGSVLVAGRQALVLAGAQPTGWRLIGRTPVALVDLDADRPAVHAPGDYFCYRPIRHGSWDSYAGMTMDDCRE